jgi:hypothetical protein
MATPTTLKDLSNQVRDLYRSARARAQQDLADAQKALAAAKAQQTADADALGTTQKAIAALRAQLAGTEVPADLAALTDQIAALQVTERRQQAALLDDADAAAAAQARSDAATGFLATVTASLADAEAAVGPAADDYDRRQRLKGAAVAAPLDTLKADATAFLGGTAFSDAEDRIEAELPTELRDALDAGLAAENDRQKAANDALAKATSLLATEWATGGPDGTIAGLRVALAAADDALRQWAEQARSRYDNAVAQVAAVSAGATLLTLAEEAALTAGSATGAPAAALRQAREEKRKDWVDAVSIYDQAVQVFRGANPSADAATVAADATVTAKAGDAATAKGDLDTAVGDYGASDQTDYGEWSGSIPEAAWRRVAGLKEAAAALNDLKGTTNTALVTAVTNAESSLAGALWTAAQHALKAAWLAQEVAMRTTLAARASTARQTRLLAAVRGDA